MKRSKTYAIRLKEANRRILSVLLTVIVVAFLLRFDVVAKIVAQAVKSVTGKDVAAEDIQFIAGLVFSGFIGITLVKIGIAFAAVPFAGVAAVVVGVSLLVVTAVKTYNAFSPVTKINNLK